MYEHHKKHTIIKSSDLEKKVEELNKVNEKLMKENDELRKRNKKLEEYHEKDTKEWKIAQLKISEKLRFEVQEKEKLRENDRIMKNTLGRRLLRSRSPFSRLIERLVSSG